MERCDVFHSRLHPGICAGKSYIRVIITSKAN